MHTYKNMPAHDHTVTYALCPHIFLHDENSSPRVPHTYSRTPPNLLEKAPNDKMRNAGKIKVGGVRIWR